MDLNGKKEESRRQESRKKSKEKKEEINLMPRFSQFLCFFYAKKALHSKSKELGFAPFCILKSTMHTIAGKLNRLWFS
ncbi:hypothetical protein ACFL6I_09605 [candidate division KSB1 bacterium]